MIKSKKQMFIVIGAFALVMLLGTVTYAFFNYTRKGSSNVIKTGRISFTSSQDGNTSYYKVLADDTVKDGEYVLVGYIRPGQSEVNGKIGIKAYLDASKILISDTYDGTESDNMGTLNSMAEGKTVLTTNEWNSIQGNNAISFKVRVQANEGIWVGEPLSRNDMKAFPTEITSIKSTFTEINFIRMSEEMIDTHADLIDLTADGGQGVVKAWIDGTKLYIASPGETYFPVDSWALFSNYSNVTRINFNNINTSSVTNMMAMFSSCSSLTSIDLSEFDTRNVTNMQAMFNGCSSLTNIDISGFDMSSVTNMSAMFIGCSSLQKIDLHNKGGNNLSGIGGMFNGCTNLKEINMSGFNFGTASMGGLFAGLAQLQIINLTNANTSSVQSMGEMFNGCSKLEKLNLSGLGGDRLASISHIFKDCTNLKEINMSGFNFGSSLLSPGGIFSDSSVEIFNLSGANFRYGTSLRGLFTGMSHLKVIDLSNIILNDNITDVSGLFYNDSILQTIYVSNTWNVNNITSSDGMFYGCTSLVGGAGTTFDSNYTDKTYAHIDGGQSNPGYLTLKTN